MKQQRELEAQRLADEEAKQAELASQEKAGDAMATVKLFKMLLDKDLNKTIVQDSIKSEPKYKMAPNLKTIVEELPALTGIYYMHDSYGNIIYIGKSKNIRSRVNQHFTNTNNKSIK